ncbi:pullulanase-type alpha-1,6-glucosidase [Thalassiella azotivora]
MSTPSRPGSTTRVTRVTRPRRRVLALAAAAAVVSPLLAAVPAGADHTAQPTVVTVVGSLQSELGCDGDWQPGCATTALERVDDTDVWTADLDVPAGAHEVKVALGGAWGEDYGAGGAPGGANIPLVLAGDATVTFRYDHGSHLLTFAPADEPAPLGPGDADLVPASLRAPTTDERFYFVMADRFANGDPGNDTGGSPSGDRLVHGFDPGDKGFFHGGDVAGILEQLDYIEGLGTTAIWMTPSFANKPVQGAPGDESAGYHGYWVTDFTRIDPHLGTNEELKALVDAAHDRGMKVFFDIITNHTADVLDYPADAYDANGSVPYVSKADEPYRDADGEPFDDRAYAGTGEFPEVDLESFPYTPTFRSDDDRDAKTPDWLNDPTLYHNRGTSTFAGEDSEYGDFPSGPYSALDDLWTEHPRVVEGMVDIYSTWVEDIGIDGFRIDTVKHVNMQFWQQFGPALQEAAAATGDDDFLMFGEVYDADPRFMSQYTTEGRLQAAVDFGFQARGVDFAKGAATTGIRDFYALDDWYTDTDSNAYQLPTFLGNHDMGRVGSFLTQAFPEATDDELLARDRLAHDLMYLTRGQPVVYYGDEQGFATAGEGPNGSIGDRDAREDMFPSQVASYNDNDLIGTDATTAEANYDPGHPLYQHIAGLAELREEHPALADGTQVHRYASSGPGIYAFSRIDREEQVEYVVAVNNATEPAAASVPTYSTRTPFRSVVGDLGTVRSDAEGRVQVEVPALGTVVLRAVRPLQDRRDAPDVDFATPRPGGVVGGGSGAAQDRAEVRVTVPENVLAEVGFAWRPVGTDDWQRLGTDDNAPYRVFHDVSGLADGTLVEYRAVLRDSSGNLAVTSSNAVVGDAPTGGGGGGPVGPVEQPDAVSVPGSLNSEMGCPGDWQPDCAQAQLTLDTDDGIWKGTFDLPAGGYEFKAAIDGSWDENYGAGGARDGSNIPFEHAGGPVTFFYDHRTHWVTNDVLSPVLTAPGSFQSELGCPGDWQPDCMLPWLQDPDGDGIWTYVSDAVPAGSYEVKVAHGLGWDENYGAGGVAGGPNIAFTVPADGVVTTFSYTLATHVLTVTTSTVGAAPDLGAAKAHWVERDLVAWPADALPPGLDADQVRWRLHHAPEGGLAVDAEWVTGGDSAPLTLDPGGLPQDVRERFPHLADHLALRLDRRTARDAESILTGQVAVAQYDDLGRLTDATGVQVPGVVDDLWPGATDADLGVTWRGRVPSLALWAPTAKDVDVLVWPAGGAGDPQRLDARRDRDGVWTVVGRPTWKDAEYLWAVRVYAPSTGQVEENLVTDPYSVALTTDSQRSVVVDLDDPALAPAQWRTARAPELAQPEDSTIYELHVRDYSVGDPQVPAEHRGTYLAFADEGQGRAHLRALAESGLNTVHLLPTFDIATIPERREDQAEPPCDLASFPPDSPEQQACIAQVRAQDAFNWGYDPWHFSTPEGSYATRPDGGARIAEFRTMVGALHADGLRVVLDQVFNHTHASGQDPRSVLDRVVPGYYHRLDPRTGAVETSTCCQNVATEHAMAEKLMVDSVVTWARDHKVDGFRFDLMGHHSRRNMERVRAALDELTVRRDGVDGSQVYLYGEGWDFGEVAGNARFEQATQGQLDGTGIGTFSDRLRDAVRGGGPFDEDPRLQGFATGLFTDPNASEGNGTPQEQRARLLHHGDLVKLGMAGNLRDFELLSASGEVVRGEELDYNGQPAGYASEPDEVVTYVDAHDNETLWDALTLKLPADTPMDERVRMNTVALSTVALSQTPAFWHAGADLLRSKSLDRNSYDSGDWFNHIGWDGEDNGFGRGLPPAWDNEAKWPYQQPLLADPALKPSPQDVATASQAARELLEIRFSSPLLRLGSAELIQDRVTFPVGGPDQAPGVVVMHVDDTGGTDLDPEREGLLVVVNASDEPVTQAVPGLAGERLSLHPVQAEGADPVVQRTRWRAATGTVTVPARTVAVLSQR